MGNQFSFDAAAKSLRENSNPPKITRNKENKIKFQRAYKPIRVLDLYACRPFLPLWLLISSKERQESIIDNVQVRLGNNSKTKALASHHGMDTTQQKTLQRFFVA